MKNSLISILGWYGTVAIIAAYALVSFSILSPTETTYQILNLSGAIGIVLVSLQKKAYPPAVLNIIWAVVAIFAIFKIIF